MLLLSRSMRRKLLATALGVAAFWLLYQATVIDSRSVPAARVPATGDRAEYVATAYCKGDTTASGVAPQSGVAAADPRLLPEGSVVRLDGLPERQTGIYTILDTGPSVIGSHLDLYMWSCYDALAFGRRPVMLTVLRLGWNPGSAPKTSAQVR
jgi:3D (Asp-Asp-Asp) domain-containing protein